MPRRIEIEITSSTASGGFTWRAKGAKQPKGVVAASLLPAGVGVGAVVKAEVESGLEGTDVVAVLAPESSPTPEKTELIEILGSKRHTSEVSVTYAPGSRRRGEGDGERDERRSRRPGAERPSRGRSERPRERLDAGSEGTERARAERPSRGRSERPRERLDAGSQGTERARADRPRREPGRAPSGERRERRPTISTVHRNALLATLGPHELAVAEQLLRGGLPAVRQALAEHGATSSDATTNAEAVIALAEALLPRLNTATWKDRAASAQTSGRDLRLRELKMVVTASKNLPLDDEGRAMAKSLAELLTQRVTAVRSEWLDRLTKTIDSGRIPEALVLATKTPDPGTRLPAELAVKLAEAAGAALHAQLDPTAWNELLEGVVASPVRRTVKPVGIPDLPDCQDHARRAAGAVPALAKLLGLPIPPPPPRRPPAARRVVLSRSSE